MAGNGYLIPTVFRWIGQGALGKKKIYPALSGGGLFPIRFLNYGGGISARNETMKRTRKPKAEKQVEPVAQPNIRKGLSLREANDGFVSASKNKDNVVEPAVAAFMTIITRCLALSRGYLAFSDVIRESKAFELDVQTQLRPLWEKYTECMINWNKLEPIQSLDEQLYLIVN